jgi:hypothetical protein
MSLDYKNALMSAARSDAKPLNIAPIDLSSISEPSHGKDSVARGKRATFSPEISDNEGKSGSGQTERRKKKAEKGTSSKPVSEKKVGSGEGLLSDVGIVKEDDASFRASAMDTLRPGEIDLLTKTASKDAGQTSSAGSSQKGPRLADVDKDDHKKAFAGLLQEIDEISAIPSHLVKVGFSTGISGQDDLIGEIELFVEGLELHLNVVPDTLEENVDPVIDDLLAYGLDIPLN